MTNERYCAFCGIDLSKLEGFMVCLNHEDVIVIFRDHEYDLIMGKYEITFDLKEKNMTLYLHECDEGNCELSPKYDYFSYGTEIMKVDFNKMIKPEEFCKTLNKLKKMIPFS